MVEISIPATAAGAAVAAGEVVSRGADVIATEPATESPVAHAAVVDVH